MMGNKRSKTSGKRRELEERALNKLASVLQKVQLGWSRWMGKWFNRWPRKAQIAAASTVLLASLVYCTALVSGRINLHIPFNNGKPDISTPRLIEQAKPGMLPSARDPTIKRIMLFRKYLDSLAGSVTGRVKLDSIRRLHPGMLDSLAQVEKMYNQNKNEK